MNTKKFTLYFLLIIVAFVVYNALIWNFSTKHILERGNGTITGDMSRMSYLSSIIHPRNNDINLSKLHIDSGDYNFKKIDMLTLGDSFSNGASGGLNRYYQDYISTYYNLNILNIHSYKKFNRVDTILVLLNSGLLSKMGIKYVLYESTQRAVVTRLTSNINLNIIDSQEDIVDYYQFNSSSTKNVSQLKLPKTSFINNGNFKFLAYNFLYNFSDHAFISKVYIAETKENLFSKKPFNKFLYYTGDLKSIPKNTNENLYRVNKNLNKLAKKLKEKNIQLIFMPAVSKYDLYSTYIVNNKYPKDKFFDILRPLKKDYIFIDTKDILSKELEKGEKDIFYIDDTHWSYKASDAISRYLKSIFALHE